MQIVTRVLEEDGAIATLGGAERLFLRRVVSSATLRPGDLILRLREIAEGRQAIDLDAPGARPEPRP